MSATRYPQACLRHPARVERHPGRCHARRYSELSWDVVEPVTYFTSQLWAILGYCYFLASPLAHPLRLECVLRLELRWGIFYARK